MIILYAEVYRAINKRKQWDFSKSNPEEKTLFRSLQTAVVTSALQNFVSKEEKPKGGAPAAKPVRYQPSFNLTDSSYVGTVHLNRLSNRW